MNRYALNTEMSDLIVPDFPTGLQWFNSPPLSFHRELKGKIVVLDFWTYCCINCLHTLPDLVELADRYSAEPVAFVGVHSAKFANERVDEHIRQAILRYGIHHPVVNDSDMILWKELGVRSWPTLVVVGADGSILARLSGEGHKDEVNRLLAAAIKYTDETLLNHSSLPVSLEQDQQESTPLAFPGKVALDEAGERLFISDTNHNRLVVTTSTGELIAAIGSGEAALRDGDYTTCQFNHPQGVSYHHGFLYVADTENHAIREIDLESEVVTTIAGTGDQGQDRKGGHSGPSQPLSSPWDVAAWGDKLFIAMAGTHQIWIYDLEKGTCYAFSGSGAELNLNHNDLGQAGWAQPSGLSFGDHQLIIADSESSTIRGIDLRALYTYTIVGGDPLNPQNLFSYGDVDGVGGFAKLQHPLGITYLPPSNEILVADTYNHRIKRLNLATRTLTSWIGTGQPGHQDGPAATAQFFEPSGLALTPDQQTLYIADTNNHAIRIVDLSTTQVSTLSIPLLKRPVTRKTLETGSLIDTDETETVVSEPIPIQSGSDGEVMLRFLLPEGVHHASGGLSQWKVRDPESLLWHVPRAYRYGVLQDDLEAHIPFMAGAEKGTVEIEVLFYTCREKDVCHLHQLLFEIPLIAGDEENIEVILTYEPPE